MQVFGEGVFALNIYSFIGSPDIADHCQKTSHVFNSLEMAVIIAKSTRSIEEKHEAYREIIFEYPDMPIPENMNFEKKESLHDFLREYIVWEKKEISWFCSLDDKAVYRLCGWSAGFEFSDLHEGCFSTYEKALTSVCINCDLTPKGIRQITNIQKVYIDADYYIVARFNSSNKLCGLELSDNWISQDVCPGNLEMVFVHIPNPFKKGDILMMRNGKPILLVDLPHWRDDYNDFLSGIKGDGTDMCTYHLCIDENGDLHHGHKPFYEMQYYNIKLSGQEQFLKYLSCFVRENDIGKHLENLLSVYNALKIRAQSDRTGKILSGWKPWSNKI